MPWEDASWQSTAKPAAVSLLWTLWILPKLLVSQTYPWHTVDALPDSLPAEHSKASRSLADVDIVNPAKVADKSELPMAYSSCSA